MRACITLVLAGLVVSLAVSQEDTLGDEIRKLLDEGIGLYKRGQYAEAYDKFEQAFQKKPSSDLVYAFMKRAGEDVVGGMMNAPDEKIRNVGLRIFELAKPGEPTRLNDPKIINGYLTDLKEGVSQKRFDIQQLALWHLKNIGSFTVKHLLPILADRTNDDLRTAVLRTLTEMGTEASLALIEALDSKNIFLRQNAGIVLGNIKDERAVPALKRLYDDPNEPPEMKQVAHEALQKITRQESSRWKKATDLYFEIAHKYATSDSSVIHAWTRSYVFWKWDREKDVLTERQVPRFALNELLAEEALYDLLDLDPDYNSPDGESAFSLLAAVHFAEAIESETALEAYLNAMRSGEDATKDGLKALIKGIEGRPESELKSVYDAIDQAADTTAIEQAAMGYFRKNSQAIRAAALGTLVGRPILYQTLARSMKDGNDEVAARTLEAIGEMGQPEDLPLVTAGGTSPGTSLIEALTHEDKRIRYGAARTMARINPLERRLGMELVIPNLIDAIGEQGVRVALIIYDVQTEEDRNTVNTLRKTLLSIGVFPVVATNASEGMLRARAFPTEDVVMIQYKVAGQVYFREDAVRRPVVETVFDALRDDVRTSAVPRYLLCETAETEAAKRQYDGTAARVIDKSVDKLDLQKALEETFDTPEAKKDSKDRADEMARLAALTLESIDPTNTLYPYKDAVDALIKVASPEILREDFIRIPAIRALGRYGDPKAIDVLAKILADKAAGDDEKAARQKPVRHAAAKALSAVFRGVAASPAGEIFLVLKQNLFDGDYEVEMAVAEALGNARLSNEQRRELSAHKRLQRESSRLEE